jgi:hypothetical protein
MWRAPIAAHDFKDRRARPVMVGPNDASKSRPILDAVCDNLILSNKIMILSVFLSFLTAHDLDNMLRAAC